MKKQCYFLLGILVAFSSLFVSCDENEDDLDPTICKITVTCTEGGKVKISKYLDTSENVPIGSEIEVVATPDEGYEFTGWYVGDSAEEPIGTEPIFTFIATKNTTLTAHFTKLTYKAVDLGLPSGIKWAAHNVGATKSEEYGGYYAWGETEEKEYYDWSNYKWCNGNKNTMTKYCTNSKYGTVDNKTVLDPEDDVAHVKWGGTWRMPTEDELQELINNCTWTWTTQNGVNGYKVTSKTNGNSIFLPAAGYRRGTDLSRSGGCGEYWSSSLFESDSYSANDLYFESGDYVCDALSRYYGSTVRPVCE